MNVAEKTGGCCRASARTVELPSFKRSIPRHTGIHQPVLIIHRWDIVENLTLPRGTEDCTYALYS
jgi:hypothetical protein